MLKKLLIIFCLIASTAIITCMEEKVDHKIQYIKDTSDADGIFNHIVKLIKEQKEDEVIKAIDIHVDLWQSGFFFTAKDTNGNNLLHLSCIFHCYKIIDYLISNDFPVESLNYDFNSAYDIRCAKGIDCSDCDECLNHLPKIEMESISLANIIEQGGTLEKQFNMALVYEFEKREILDLIERLIDHNFYKEAQKLIEETEGQFDSPYAFTSAINKWKLYKKNNHIKDLIEALLIKNADLGITNEDIDAYFVNHSDLKKEYDKLVKNRNNPSVINVKTVRKKESHLYQQLQKRKNSSKSFHFLLNALKSKS